MPGICIFTSGLSLKLWFMPLMLKHSLYINVWLYRHVVPGSVRAHRAHWVQSCSGRWVDLQSCSEAVLNAGPAEKHSLLLLFTIFFIVSHTLLSTYWMKFGFFRGTSCDVICETKICLEFLLQYFSCWNPLFLAALITCKSSFLFFQLKLFQPLTKAGRGIPERLWLVQAFLFTWHYVWVRIFSQSSWNAVVNRAKFALLENATLLTLSHLLLPITIPTLLPGWEKSIFSVSLAAQGISNGVPQAKFPRSWLGSQPLSLCCSRRELDILRVFCLLTEPGDLQDPARLRGNSWPHILGQNPQALLRSFWLFPGWREEVLVDSSTCGR